MPMFSDRSGTITSGGVAQVLAPALNVREGFWVQNLSSGDLWINDNGTAAAQQPSMLLPPGAFYETASKNLSDGAISIFGATTGQAFAAREW